MINDHDWQAAYNAGKADAERGLVEALDVLMIALNRDHLPSIFAIENARTAVAKYREDR